MSETIENRIRRILKENIEIGADVNSITLDDRLSDFGMNSVSFIKLIVACEIEFGIEVEDENLDINKLSTMGGLVSYLEERISV